MLYKRSLYLCSDSFLRIHDCWDTQLHTVTTGSHGPRSVFGRQPVTGCVFVFQRWEIKGWKISWKTGRLTLVLQRWYFLAVPVQVMLSFPAATFFLWTENKHLEKKRNISQKKSLGEESSTQIYNCNLQNGHCQVQQLNSPPTNQSKEVSVNFSDGKTNYTPRSPGDIYH